MGKRRFQVRGTVRVYTTVLASNHEEASDIAARRTFIQGCEPDPNKTWTRVPDGEIEQTLVIFMGDVDGKKIRYKKG